jgi:LAO/AO transport system kinase
MVDVFVLLVQPSSGDELQGIKRGVMELADLVLVTKADGDLLTGARQSVADHRSALELLHHHDAPPVLACSSRDGTGIAEAWEAITRIDADRTASGERNRRRRDQNRRWLWTEVDDVLHERLTSDAAVRSLAPDVETAVVNGTIAPARGALQLLEAFGSSR